MVLLLEKRRRIPAPRTIKTVVLSTLLFASIAHLFSVNYISTRQYLSSTSVSIIDSAQRPEEEEPASANTGNLMSSPNYNSSLGRSSVAVAISQDTKVQVFYNLFTPSAQDEVRVRKIVEEQFSLINPSLHDTISVTSIGYLLPLANASLGNATYNISHHYEEGNEYLTLRELWNYCKSNPQRDIKVVYLHSKGSFHPHTSNDNLRKFLTDGALSMECAKLPETCDVCSSRMSPLPHPHTSGNMWLARCDYISHLIDPLAVKEGKLPKKMRANYACKGWGRYFSEHWVHSHPSVHPCDLYPGKEYVWNYARVPTVPFEKDLQMVPRFKFEDYVIKEACGANNLKMENFLEGMKDDYKMLYNIKNLPDDWWLWDFLNQSHVESK